MRVERAGFADAGHESDQSAGNPSIIKPLIAKPIPTIHATNSRMSPASWPSRRGGGGGCDIDEKKNRKPERRSGLDHQGGCDKRPGARASQPADKLIECAILDAPRSWMPYCSPRPAQ